VTGLTFVSFVFMVSYTNSVAPLFYSSYLQVISSIVASWTDFSSALGNSLPAASNGISAGSLQAMTGVVQYLNIGYFWMLVNCLTSAAYVCPVSSSTHAR
jgi:GDP-mannose transporter